MGALELVFDLAGAEDVPALECDPEKFGGIRSGADAFDLKELVEALGAAVEGEDADTAAVEVGGGEHFAADRAVAGPVDEVVSPADGFGDVGKGKADLADAFVVQSRLHVRGLPPISRWDCEMDGAQGFHVLSRDESVVVFEDAEAALEFPLGGGFLTGIEEGLAGGRGIVDAEILGFAGGSGGDEDVRGGPEAGAGEEVVLHAGAGELLEVLIGEVVVDSGADVLVGDVDAADAFVVGRQGDGDVVEAVEGKGVLVALDVEDAFVGAKVDFDHDVPGGELLEQGGGVVLIHDVDAVADALGVAELDGLADVEAKAFGRDKAGSEFAGVEADGDARIDGVEVVEHLHVEGVVAHGDEAVFGHDEVDADEAGFVGVEGLLDGFEAEEGLGEDLLGRKAAKDLVDVTDFDLAGAEVLWGSAVLDLAALVFSGADFVAAGGDFVAEAMVEELLTKGGEVGAEADLVGDGGRVAEGWGLHELKVLLVLSGGARGDFVDPFAGVRSLEAREVGEGGEELVVPAEAGHGDETAQGEGVDQAVVEVLVGGCHVSRERGGRDELGGARGLGEFEGGGVDAEAVLGGVANKGLGVDCAGEMDVEVGAFGELLEEGAKGERALVTVAEKGARGAGFGFGDAGFGRVGAGGEKQGEAGEKTDGAAHDCLPV